MTTNGRPEPLLRLEGINTYYGQMHILQDVNLEVGEGELVCLLGGNASGKSTTLKTVLGIVPSRSGSVSFGGEDVTRFSTSRRIERGLAIVPENRRLFGPMTVLENLEMGAYLRPRADLKDDLDRVYSLFPHLAERRKQLAGTLSGGEQQMVAMGRALMGRPKLLLMDEPTSGVDVRTRHEVLHLLDDLHRDGLAIVLTTHDLNGMAAHLPHLVCLNVEVLGSGPPRDVLTADVLERTYGARMEILEHGGMPIVVDDYASHDNVVGLKRKGA